MTRSVKPASPRQELTDGLIAAFPVTASLLPFALLLGALAAEKGISTLESGLMSALVLAGSGQYAAVNTWDQTFAGQTPLYLSLGIASLIINFRHVFMSASLRRHMVNFPRAIKIISLFFMADEVWAMSEMRACRRPLTPLFYLGLAAPFYLCWVFGTALGTQFGSMVENPALYGFDFAFIAIFICLIVGFRDRPGFAPTLLASATVAVVVDHFAPGPASIACGAIAGIAAAGLAYTPTTAAITEEHTP